MWRYLIASFISLIFRLSYLFVPLYDLYCQTTGYRGTVSINPVISTKESLSLKPITITFFSSSNNDHLTFDFKPNNSQLVTFIGKPTLAFYTIHNKTNHSLQGVRTYNVSPRKAAPYFHKIECFCFDEQRIKPYEQIELPILFYIEETDIQFISINYTFYLSKD